MKDELAAPIGSGEELWRVAARAALIQFCCGACVRRQPSRGCKAVKQARTKRGKLARKESVQGESWGNVLRADVTTTRVVESATTDCIRLEGF